MRPIVLLRLHLLLIIMYVFFFSCYFILCPVQAFSLNLVFYILIYVLHLQYVAIECHVCFLSNLGLTIFVGRSRLGSLLIIFTNLGVFDIELTCIFLICSF